MHLDLGFALLILGMLFLLAFSPWFRRFALALVCLALLVVAAGVGYMEINRKNDQAMAQKCLAPPSPFSRKFQNDPPPGVVLDDREGCDKWLAEHPQAEAEHDRALAERCLDRGECEEWRAKSEQNMAQKCPPVSLFSPCKEWLAEHPQTEHRH